MFNIMITVISNTTTAKTFGFFVYLKKYCLYTNVIIIQIIILVKASY